MVTPLRSEEIVLEAEPSGVRVARQFFVGVAESLDLDPDHVLMGELAVSELVTNAVLYSDGPICVRVSFDDDGCRVEVSDPNPEPDPLRPPDLDTRRVGGRGLALVAAVTSTWGSEPHPARAGKTVWFTLPATDAQVV